MWTKLYEHKIIFPLGHAHPELHTAVIVLWIKVLRPSGPNYWKNVEWIPYVFCEEYCSECQTNRVIGQKIGTITFCHL